MQANSHKTNELRFRMSQLQIFGQHYSSRQTNTMHVTDTARDESPVERLVVMVIFGIFVMANLLERLSINMTASISRQTIDELSVFPIPTFPVHTCV